jgi:hypothetical protein
MATLRLCLLQLCLISATEVYGEPLSVFLQPSAPFVLGREDDVSGPYTEAFAKLLNQEGFTAQFKLLPPRRALRSFEQTPRSCLLATHYTQDLSEAALYLGKVAPLVFWAYSLESDKWPMDNLSVLKERTIAGSEIPELRYMSEQYGLNYQRLPEANSGFDMLQHRRFQVLLGDVGIQLQAKQQGVELRQLQLPINADRWLVCQRDLSREQQIRLKAAIAQGLFAASTASIWQHHGLAQYYLDVRRDWLHITDE